MIYKNPVSKLSLKCCTMVTRILKVIKTRKLPLSILQIQRNLAVLCFSAGLRFLHFFLSILLFIYLSLLITLRSSIVTLFIYKYFFIIMSSFKHTIFTLIDFKSQFLFCPVFILFSHFYCMLYVRQKICKYDLIETNKCLPTQKIQC